MNTWVTIHMPTSSYHGVLQKIHDQIGYVTLSPFVGPIAFQTMKLPPRLGIKTGRNDFL